MMVSNSHIFLFEKKAPQPRFYIVGSYPTLAYRGVTGNEVENACFEGLRKNFISLRKATSLHEEFKRAWQVR